MIYRKRELGMEGIKVRRGKWIIEERKPRWYRGGGRQQWKKPKGKK